MTAPPDPEPTPCSHCGGGMKLTLRAQAVENGPIESAYSCTKCGRLDVREEPLAKRT
jgi:hypothetical protein